MGKGKHSGKPPQARHAAKSPSSRHDKRARLDRTNPQRQKTQRASVPLVGETDEIASSMARILDARSGFRLPIIIAGALLASGRRTASQWFRAAGVKDDWDRYYDVLIAIGKK